MDNKNMLYGAGCTPSVMDGTEHTINVGDKITLPESFNWKDSMPPIKNQGNTQKCVCYSLTSVLDFYTNSENGVANVCNNYDINELYNSRANKMIEGMTIKEALHYLHHNGLNSKKIGSYAKITSDSAAKYALINFGPIVIGLPVYNDTDKFWQKTPFSNFQGGHAVTIVGYDDVKQEFTLRNSWGTMWANHGYTTISYKDFMDYVFEAWTVAL